MRKPQKQYDILTFGSITLDIFLTPDFSDTKITKKGKREWFEFPVGEKIKVSQVLKMCGGGSANTSTGFAKMGLRPAIFGIIGDDEEGHLIQKKLKKYNIDTQYLTIEKNGISSFSMILMAPDGKRTVFHDQASQKHFSRTTLKNAPLSRALYISHLYNKSSVLLEEIPAWKKKTQGFVCWNPGKTQFKAGFKKFKKIFPYIDLLILNREESEYFTGLSAKKTKKLNEVKKVIAGSEFDTQEKFDLRSIAQKFLHAGVHTIVITDGKNGAQLFDQDKNSLWCPSPDVPIASTLGAGDAFSVGIITAMLKGASAENKIRWGTFNAGSVIQKFGAQNGQLSLKEIRQMAR